MSNPVVMSIVIPMFKAEDRIAQTLSSITQQGRSDIEIICVDDVSPDNQVAVVEALRQQNPAIRLIRNARNVGPGGSTNAGIDAAVGDYIVIVHADDTLLPGALDSLQSHITAHQPDLVLIGCDEVRRGKVRALTDETLTDQLAAHPGLLTAQADPRVLLWPPGPWSKVYRREFLNQNALRFPEGVFEDIPWSIHTTVRAEKITVLPGPVYRYVTAEGDSSITTTLTARNLDRLSQIRLIRDGLDIHSLDSGVRQHISALVAIHLIWANRSAYKTLPPDTHEQFFVDSAAELRWWHDVAPVARNLSTEPLMATRLRNVFYDALLSGEWKRWQRATSRQKTARKIGKLLGHKKLGRRQ